MNVFEWLTRRKESENDGNEQCETDDKIREREALLQRQQDLERRLRVQEQLVDVLRAKDT